MSEIEANATGVIRVEVPRVFITSAKPGAGVSTIVIGLLASLRRVEVSPVSATIGPSLIESTRHRRIMERFSFCLDPWLLDEQQLLDGFARASSGAEFVVLEGTGRFFDPSSSAGRSHVDVARQLGAPVLLVVDGRDYLGNNFDDLKKLLDSCSQSISAVIANFVVSLAQSEALAEFFDRYAGPRFLGGIRKSSNATFVGKPSVVLDTNPSLITRNQVLRLANLIDANLNVDLLREIADEALSIEIEKKEAGSALRNCRVAVADDQAFHITIQDNLDLLRRAGAELLMFSPLIDGSLPANTAAVYLPGAYTGLYLEDLLQNQSMLASLREFGERGGIVYAEGSAVPYLCTDVVLPDGTESKMVGLISGRAKLRGSEKISSSPVYAEATILEPSILSRYCEKLRGIKVSDWIFERIGNVPVAFNRVEYSYSNGSIRAGEPCNDGAVPKPNILAAELNLHWGSAQRAANSFVEVACLQQQKKESRS